jgi:hypothetical protein
LVWDPQGGLVVGWLLLLAHDCNGYAGAVEALKFIWDEHRADVSQVVQASARLATSSHRNDQAQQISEVKEMIDNPPEWLREWSSQIGVELKDGLRVTSPSGSA